ncbi:bifunctional proline dehydrogenase/pyrroline-5-carboxylate dehydrogenase [Psychromonas sp. CNPT3]|uniref:bifunctional proline dehydrogenase/L-glutamate gamma-semialdehyde dehydrogenase PutA n=1 Tax=Psychromonas sp. CNPT3 TaxID=314282 RepID=UPI00006E764C|nr:bifunctional proline dehydrogenase/L-glutamate gamma-semialdehyde dehydrogenase PutA [Psychromonas sp. CNPT3]AGH80326.1 bifunctional proline dehydrogenase/pyrroline-5-carboxylate dehydrogenase [Psychromonas sp. CNPT3]
MSTNLHFCANDTLSEDFIERPIEELWSLISPLYMVDEALWLKELLPMASATALEKKHIADNASELIRRVRADKKSVQMIDALLLEYSLDSKEGVLLMCLAEALMRIPDIATADALIRDKLSVADWKSHLKNSDSVFVNASTWGLLLTGKVVSMDVRKDGSPASMISRLVNRASEPVIRNAMNQAMKIMGYQFVLGRSIKEAQKNGKNFTDQGINYSYDMLGESALTSEDAKKYFKSYVQAIESVGVQNNLEGASKTEATVSIKLSALHPRYEVAQKDRVLNEMYNTVIRLIKLARSLNVGLTIDAEEADRLELSLVLFEKLYRSEEAQGWGKLGLVVQAYMKRALPVLVWLAALAKSQGDRIPLRLVKGAYWDSELKLSQQKGYAAYPVYTRKEATDVSYLACARFLLAKHIQGLIYPQFASHNAQTISAIAVMSTHPHYEFQRLHGMGESLYRHALDMFADNLRIYAPVGSHQDLLPYLVRRLLENGANSSFVHRLVDANCPVDELTEHPVDTLEKRSTLHNGLIPLPPYIFAERKNSSSINVDIESECLPFETLLNTHMHRTWVGGAIVNGERHYASQTSNDVQLLQQVNAPYDKNIHVGSVLFSSPELVSEALQAATDFYPIWSATPVTIRAKKLNVLADLLESNMPELVALCHLEAGKTLHDSIDEVREAIDFCRYYAHQANEHLSAVHTQIGFDEISRNITRQGRGVFVCISPWNFPLAIFIGQVGAALVSGNTVIAKPAEQTSLIAARTVELMLSAGFPEEAIHLLPGTGKDVGSQLTKDARIQGVVFTGSTPTAQLINRTLASRDTLPVPFIAETGGLNAMIVDSTALPEQVARDVVNSAFSAAGQRCSALRVLFIQEDIADRVLTLIKGAMAELKIGVPYLHSTDVGPVIDEQAKTKLEAHIQYMTDKYQLLAHCELDASCAQGHFVAPTMFEINALDNLESEQFGPILHVIRYRAEQLEQVVKQINDSEFGLTLGIHSRNEASYQCIEAKARVGNCYINRDQIGAAVGVQPFGGQGLSGTGPKAGGPRYLYRFTKQWILDPQTMISQTQESRV